VVIKVFFSGTNSTANFPFSLFISLVILKLVSLLGDNENGKGLKLFIYFVGNKEVGA
jgi:hypothetical protein